MKRIGKNFLSGADFDDVSQVQHANSVGNVLDHAQVVSDKEVCASGMHLNILHEVNDLRLNRNVKGRYAFVGNNQLGFHDERAGDTDALALPAGELMRVAFGMRGR